MRQSDAVARHLAGQTAFTLHIGSPRDNGAEQFADSRFWDHVALSWFTASQMAACACDLEMRSTSAASVLRRSQDLSSHVFSLAVRARPRLCASISRTEAASAVGSPILTTCPQLGRPFPGILGQALSRRAQTNRDRVNTIGEEAQPDAFGTAHRHEQRPPIHELDVVVVLGLVSHASLATTSWIGWSGSRRVRPLMVPKPCLG